MKSKSHGPYGLMFHYFHDGLKHKPSQGSISKDQFEKILKKVDLENIIPAKKWADKTENDSLENNEICITFDDGLRCQYDVALPILEKYNLTAFWFVNSSTLVGEINNLEIFRRFRNDYFSSITEFYDTFFSTALESNYKNEVKQGLEKFPKNYLSEFTFYTLEDRKFRYLRDKVLNPIQYEIITKNIMKLKGVTTKDLAKDLWISDKQLCTLKKMDHIIGIHSHSHPTVLVNLSYEEQKREYEKNIEILSDILNEKPFTMAHPCNSYSDETLEILDKMGIKIGFCSNMMKTNYSKLEIPRKDSALLI